MNSLKMLFEISFQCKRLLTGGALKWPRVAVNCLVLAKITFSCKCFRANRTQMRPYASVHRFLVSLEGALLPKRSGTGGAVVRLNASVHHLVYLERDLHCKRFGARGAMVVSGASVHYLVSLEGALLPERSGTGGAVVRLNASVHQLVLLEIRRQTKAFVALLTLIDWSDAGVQCLMLLEIT